MFIIGSYFPFFECFFRLGGGGHTFIFNLNDSFEPIYLTYRCKSNKYCHSESEWTWQ